jgi:hypothetical protein
MSPQYLYHFELSEIPALEISCNQCKSVIRLTFPQNNLAQTLQCVGCGSLFWVPGNQIHQTMLGLIRTLGAYREQEKAQNFTVGFSLVSPASSGKD